MASNPTPREIKASQIGLRVWVQPKETDDVELDVVAVHGLGQDPDETWVHETTGINWLKHEKMLPSALKKARIMRFGYNSVWFGDNAIKQSLATVARKLLSTLKGQREECQQRPIIFIGHCLGGLVIEQAYVNAKLDPDQYPGIYDSITGIVFLGTPHRGNLESKATQAVIFDAIARARMQVQDNILHTLAQDNDTLLNVVTQFTRDVGKRQRPPELYCFYEQKACNVGGETAGIETPMEFVVNESSGAFDQYPKDGLELNHFQMNKFEDEEDGNYQSVRGAIVDMMKAARGIMNGRGMSKAFPTPQKHGLMLEGPAIGNGVPWAGNEQSPPLASYVMRYTPGHVDTGEVP